MFGFDFRAFVEKGLQLRPWNCSPPKIHSRYEEWVSTEMETLSLIIKTNEVLDAAAQWQEKNYGFLQTAESVMALDSVFIAFNLSYVRFTKISWLNKRCETGSLGYSECQPCVAAANGSFTASPGLNKLWRANCSLYNHTRLNDGAKSFADFWMWHSF